jgi:hypothetical protein
MRRAAGDALTNIYAPCQDAQQLQFLSWFHDVHIPTDADWLLVGDLNLIWSPDDRNKPGGNVNEMLLFNESINNLVLIVFLSKEENSLGVTCTPLHYYKE